MDKIIARAIELVNRQLLSSSRDASGDFILINIRNGLNQLLDSNLSKSEWIPLFCRQINRLMDYNDSISYELWMEWHDDILCITNGRNSKQLQSDSWERFLEKMEFENKLEQYELQFQAIFGKRKNFTELFCKHNVFFQDYLRKCLWLHSKIEVQGLVGNIDDLLSKVYGITDIVLTSERRQCLQKNLQYIKIDLDCSNKSLQCYQIHFPGNSNLNNFLPSTKQIEMSRSGNFEKIQDILQYNRWLVILGDPGNAKTSLLRWIARAFSEKALRNDEEFVRIPILIRIGEFAAWLDLHQTKTLIDYIGEHTWFSERYCHDDGKNVLKELIDHGHALILLDGLDEIPNVGQREQIVNLVREFINKYVSAPDFTSAFDHEKVRKHKYLYFPKTIETPLPSKSGGNQIVITSRFVGYQLYPLTGPFIKHYSLLSMEHKEAKEFVENWMILVEKRVVDILKDETIPLNEEIIENLSKKRLNSMQSMFKTKSKLLMSTPSLLSLICTLIFQSSDELHLESRVELYHHTVQASFRVWRIQQSNFSENVLTDFLINLATYLHLHSQSGLIDEFDMKRLCCLTFQQHGLANNRRKLSEYANQLISLLELNIAFVVERGLQIFAFQHLSFQEYFVGQSLVRYSSIAEVAKSILLFTIDSRFHESLLLAVGWISYNWSLDNYDQFCQYLVSSIKDYSIPFGILLLFDAFNDMKILPSNAVIITALKNLFHHLSNLIGSTYLFWNLSQLSDDIIIEWMQSDLKEEKSISKFCQCLETKRQRKSKRTRYVQKLPSVVYEQLWSLHNRSQAIEFDIDQVLRTAMVRDDITDQIFNKDFSLYLSSHANIHPLILSVIIAVCGGVYYKIEDRMLRILFSTKQMHRESSIFVPIMGYFADNKESHSIKIQILIDSYQNFLAKSSPSDITTVIVDSFIALICLQGLSQSSIYQKYENYQALPLALERFKWNWFHFMVSGQCIHLGTCITPKISFIQSELETILNIFSSQSDEQDQLFSLACATALTRLRTNYTRDLLDVINSRTNQQKSDVLLTCLPQSLQKLYSCAISSSTNETDSLPLVVFLLECLKQVNNITGDGPMFPCALSILKPLLIKHSLHNYALAMFRERYSNIEWFIQDPQRCDPFFIQKSFNWEELIDVERQGIDQDKSNEEKDLRLFTALISLARIFQAQYRSRKHHALKRNILPSVKSEKIYFAIMNILNPVLRMSIFGIILEMNDPLIFNEEQRDQLRDEMIGLLYSLIPDLSLLTSTFLFIRCYKVRLFFPEIFQEMTTIIGKKLNETSENKQSGEQEAAFIALRQLNNFDLTPYLSEFARRTNNLSDLLRFNSTIFYHYFHDIIDFKSCNMTLLSVMYLAELTFDVQNLQIYINDDHKEYMSLGKVFEQLWNESPKYKRIMTFKIAIWITKYLPQLTEKDISYIIGCISVCVSIEKRAISVIKEWLNYKTDKDLNIFAQYAALELIIEGSDIPDLIDIINTRNCSRIIFVADRLFDSPFVHSTILRQISLALQENIQYASKVSVWISRKDILQLILNLELEQLTSNVQQQNKISIRPFLLMINGCSEDLQVYLRTFIAEQFPIQNAIQEEYIAIIVKWIIERLISNNKNLLKDLYQDIFTLLHNQQYPRIQKAIINAFDTVFHGVKPYEKDVFMQDDIIIHLEKVIYSYCDYPKDVLAVCLLCYGNCLLRLQILGKNLNVSKEMKKMLIHICEKFFPETLSIRASFCLDFTKIGNREPNSILNWFKNKWTMTPEITFEILLQQTLYTTKNIFYGKDQINEHLNIYPDSIHMFVINLYNYLCKENHKKYIHDRVPDYIQIARFIREKHSEKFCNAVRNNVFGEEEFKTKLYIHSKNYPIDRTESIYLYSLFGIVTVELLDMLGSIRENTFATSEDSVNSLKQVLDRNAIEKLFDLLDQKRYHPILKHLLSILKCLVKANAISLLEIHQKLPLIDNVLYESSFPSPFSLTKSPGNPCRESPVELRGNSGIPRGVERGFGDSPGSW